jgi:hypothetical protein
MAIYKKTSPWYITKQNTLYLELLTLRTIPTSDDDFKYVIKINTDIARISWHLTFIKMQNCGGYLHKEIDQYLKILSTIFLLALQFSVQLKPILILPYQPLLEVNHGST